MRRRLGWALAFLLALVAAGAVCLWVVARQSRASGPLRVSYEPVALDPQDPARDRVGPFVYRGGLWLRSSDSRFGGLSDLRVSDDGLRLFAVTDCGCGFAASLSYDDAGRLSGLAEPRMVDLVGLHGEPLALRFRDAESLVRGPAGGLEVGFEGEGRVWAYAAEPAFQGPAADVPIPTGLAQCGRNGGLEAMARVDERRLLICETRRGRSDDVPAWLGAGSRWTPRTYPLFFDGGWLGEAFHPSGATRLPEGDVLVLERRFPPIGARVVRLSRQDLAGTGPLQPRELARFEPPLTVDNYEGIDARRDAAGRTFVYLVSDDNACAKVGAQPIPTPQRTLLLMFELAG